MSKTPISAWFGFVVILLFAVLTIAGPWLAPYGESEIVGDVWEPFSAQFLLGTDSLGRDILTRILYGARTTISIALAATLLSFFVGMTLGFLAAVVGGYVDQAISRVVDVFMSIPTLIFALVVLSVLAFDKIRIDDPVGALSVHLVNGVWGTLALGLFYDDGIATSVAALATGLSPFAQFLSQLQGVVYVGIFTFGASVVVWYAIKLTLGVRVSPEEEEEGLDIGEHGMHAYDLTPGGSFGSASAAAASKLASAASLAASPKASA